MTPSRIEETPLFAEYTVDINFWIPLKQDNDYEINDVTLEIRLVETKREVCIGNKVGYKKVSLGGKNYSYHRLIEEIIQTRLQEYMSIILIEIKIIIQFKIYSGFHKLQIT
jgi:hypothetical protein